MKIMKHLLIAMFALLPGILLSQETMMQSIEEFRYYERLNYFKEGVAKKSYNGIKGSPYLHDDFREAEVRTREDITYKGELRYNIFEDEMEYKVDGVVYWISNALIIDYIKIDNETFMYFCKEGMDSDKGCYFKALVTGDCNLLGKKGINLQDAVKPKPYQEARPAEFIKRKDIYFLQKGNTYPQRISNKKSVVEVLSDKSTEISKFIKTNKINISKEDNLIDLINYYNSL